MSLSSVGMRGSYSSKVSSGESPLGDLGIRRLSLSRQDIFSHRNPPHVPLLVHMLTQGYNHAYQELFNLIKEEEKLEERNPSGQDYVLLKNDSESLSRVALVLRSCEDFSRLGKYELCYQDRTNVAAYFQSMNKRLVALHFYRTAAREAMKITDPEEQVKCMAKADMEYGQRLHESKLLNEAKIHTELAYEILERHDGRDAELYKECCKALSAINLSMAHEVVSRSNRITATAKKLFMEAYKLVEKADDRSQTQNTCIQLAEVFTIHGKPKLAQRFLLKVKNKSSHSDLEFYAKACRELAKSYISCHDHKKALKILARSGRQIDSIKKREGYSAKTAHLKGMNCNLQGVVYNDMGKYAKAAHAGHNAIYHLDNATKSKQPKVSKEYEASISVARVNLAIARAHAHLADYMDLLQQDKEDYEKPKGLLGHKMRGLTAEILYFDQNSTIKQKRIALDLQTRSRYQVTSRKSSMVDNRSKSFSSFGRSLDEDPPGGLATGAGAHDWLYHSNTLMGHSFSDNRSSLSDDVLSGLFHTDRSDPGNLTYSYYTYEYEYDDESEQQECSDSDCSEYDLLGVVTSGVNEADTSETSRESKMELMPPVSTGTRSFKSETDDMFETFKDFINSNITSRSAIEETSLERKKEAPRFLRD